MLLIMKLILMIIKGILNFLLNLIFPPRCTFCYHLLQYWDKEQVCLKCRNDIPTCASENLCEKCGKPIEEKASICPMCEERDFMFVRSIAPFTYKDEVAEAVIRFKEQNQQNHAKPFARYMAGMINTYYSEVAKDFDGIVDVPITSKKRAVLGYNQTELLSKELSPLINVPHLPNVLTKVRSTKDQRTLTAAERKINLENAYKPKKTELIKDKTLLVVDDVFTTGSTINEVTKTLLTAGANKVYGCTFATTELARHTKSVAAEEITDTIASAPK